MFKNYQALEEKKISYEIGMLYNYLNEIEDDIQKSITGSLLIKYYNLNSSKSNRSNCPLHSGTNKTTLEFNDTKRSCTCHAGCGTLTYLQFIAKMEGIKNLNEAKIFAVTKFSNISLGFNSIEDYKDSLRKLIDERYKETGSLDLKEYYDISILPNGYNKSSAITSYNKKSSTQRGAIYDNATVEVIGTIPTVEDNFTLKELDINTIVKNLDIKCLNDKGYVNYNQAMLKAYKSNLIKDFTQSIDILNSKEKLYEFLKMKYNISHDIVDKYGLIYFEKANQSLLHFKDFTQLSDRVLFPVKDHETGIIVGYQGRNANLKLTERCKYINIADYKDELEIDNSGKEYRKMIPLPIGNFLFNLYELKDETIRSIWITEGIADTLKLTSLGYPSISPCQSNLTEHQIQLLDRYWGKDIEVNLFFDTDTNKVGQTNSIRIAYKLWQFGFKNINIIRTYAELGKDITDTSVKLQNDTLLIKFIELWYKDAFKFKPATNEDLDGLIKTNVYNEDTALTVDPRFIKEEIEFATKYSDINEFIPLIDKEIRKNPITKVKNGDITFIQNLVLSIKENFQEKVTDKTQPSEIDSVSLDTSVAATKMEPVVKNTSDVSFAKLSSKQVFHLKKKFDVEIIKIVDEYLTDKQINNIIWKIKSNEEFDIKKYLMSSKYKEILASHNNDIKNPASETDHLDKDLTPVYPVYPEDEMPF